MRRCATTLVVNVHVDGSDWWRCETVVVVTADSRFTEAAVRRGSVGPYM
jgi:hypothetical protein